MQTLRRCDKQDPRRVGPTWPRRSCAKRTSFGLHHPRLAGFAQGVGDYHELAGDGRYDHLVRLSLFPLPVGEDLQAPFVNRGGSVPIFSQFGFLAASQLSRRFGSPFWAGFVFSAAAA